MCTLPQLDADYLNDLPGYIIDATTHLKEINRKNARVNDYNKKLQDL